MQDKTQHLEWDHIVASLSNENNTSQQRQKLMFIKKIKRNWVDNNIFTNLQSITDRFAFKQLFSFLKLISTAIC